MQKLSIVVPCYNEEDVLPIFYKELIKVISSMNFDREILFIDDGSTDKTLDKIMELAARDQDVKFISFSRNFGKEAAMYAGLCNASGDYVVVMDADLQDPPELLPQMMNKIINDNYDCVATRRVTRAGGPIIRSFLPECFIV